jgi:hypothetical protein
MLGDRLRIGEESVNGNQRCHSGEDCQQHVEGDAGRYGHDPVIGNLPVDANQNVFPPAGRDL